MNTDTRRFEHKELIDPRAIDYLICLNLCNLRPVTVATKLHVDFYQGVFRPTDSSRGDR